MTVAFDVVCGLLGGIASFFVVYSLTLLAAAGLSPLFSKEGVRGSSLGGDLRMLVLIPAHDEEVIIASTIDSLRQQTYPADLLRIVVIADNCTDRTADIAAGAGADVWVRTDPDRRGKGFALAWAIERALALEPQPGGIAIVDADTWVAPDFVTLMADRIATSREPLALQGRYGVLNPADSLRAGLMAGAFELVNHIRPLGHDRLGLGAGLKGNGMAFSARTLATVPWPGASITEDIDYAIALLREANTRVEYVPMARVEAQMPVTAEQGASQRRRWEMGRYRLIREKALPLFGLGLRRLDRRMIDSAIDLMSPPLTELAAIIVVWSAFAVLGTLIGVLRHPAIWLCWIALALAGQLIYIVGGLAVARAHPAAYRGLLFAPAYGVWKLMLYATTPRRRATKASEPDEWIRTERIAPGPSPSDPA